MKNELTTRLAEKLIGFMNKAHIPIDKDQIGNLPVDWRLSGKLTATQMMTTEISKTEHVSDLNKLAPR